MGILYQKYIHVSWAVKFVGLYVYKQKENKHVQYAFRLSIFFHLFLLVGTVLLYSTVGFFAIHWHESAMDLHVFPIPIPPPTSLPTRSLWVFPMHQPRALVSCILPGLVICFTLENIHVSMLFSLNIPPSPSPTESKICSVHVCLFFSFTYRLSLPSF